MRIDAGQHLRMDQRMKLAPRMIQSMEILQLPAQALEERITQELASNPTLELREATDDASVIEAQLDQQQRDASEGERPLVMQDNESPSPDHNTQADDFERLTNIAEEYGEAWESNTYETGESYRPVRSDGERDAKMDAMMNTASRPASLADQLLDQWRMVECPPALRAAGEFLIDHIDPDGYLRAELSSLLPQAPAGITLPQLEQALTLIQTEIEPPGIGARDLRECLLIQIDARARSASAASHHDNGRARPFPNPRTTPGSNPGSNPGSAPVQAPEHAPGTAHGTAPAPLEVQRRLVADHLKDIEVNRLPRIAQATGLSIEQVKQGIAGLRQFTPYPGKLLADEAPQAITPDAIVDFDEEHDRYVARLATDRFPSLQLNTRYLKMAKDSAIDRKTRDFLGNNLRSARWLLDAISQRNHTLLRVIHVVLQAQRDWFDLGPQHLKPLPMTLVADQLGIHVATVSRAVSEKYLQTPRGIVPLRMFFSGGTETESGEAVSWAAVQAKLKEIIDAEDRSNPLSDDELVVKLKEAGIEIARRTVAKYRKQLQIASARQRREF